MNCSQIQNCSIRSFIFFTSAALDRMNIVIFSCVFLSLYLSNCNSVVVVGGCWDLARSLIKLTNGFPFSFLAVGCLDQAPRGCQSVHMRTVSAYSDPAFLLNHRPKFECILLYTVYMICVWAYFVWFGAMNSVEIHGRSDAEALPNSWYGPGAWTCCCQVEPYGSEIVISCWCCVWPDVSDKGTNASLFLSPTSMFGG